MVFIIVLSTLEWNSTGRIHFQKGFLWDFYHPWMQTLTWWKVVGQQVETRHQYKSWITERLNEREEHAFRPSHDPFVFFPIKFIQIGGKRCCATKPPKTHFRNLWIPSGCHLLCMLSFILLNSSIPKVSRSTLGSFTCIKTTDSSGAGFNPFHNVVWRDYMLRTCSFEWTCF